MGTEGMCLLNNGLNQWFSTGADFTTPAPLLPPPPPGDIWPCLGTFLTFTIGVGECYWRLVGRV